MAVKSCIANDPGEITGIYGPHNLWTVEIGHGFAEKIEAYIEDSGVTWFAVFYKGVIIARYNSAFVETLSYKLPEPEEKSP